MIQTVCSDVCISALQNICEGLHLLCSGPSIKNTVSPAATYLVLNYNNLFSTQMVQTTAGDILLAQPLYAESQNIKYIFWLLSIIRIVFILACFCVRLHVWGHFQFLGFLHFWIRLYFWCYLYIWIVIMFWTIFLFYVYFTFGFVFIPKHYSLWLWKFLCWARSQNSDREISSVKSVTQKILKCQPLEGAEHLHY